MTGIRTRTLDCGGGMPAFVAVPDGAAKAPTVIVVHERYGLVRHTASWRSASRATVMSPSRRTSTSSTRTRTRCIAATPIATSAIPTPSIALGAAIDALQAIPQADTARLAIMGICQTGRLPLVVAASRPIAAALVWYGAAQPREWAVNGKYPRPLDEIIAAVDCPVLGMFGETDHLISIDDIRRFRDCLERHGKSYDIHVYRDAPHGWLNDTMPGRYRRGPGGGRVGPPARVP